MQAEVGLGHLRFTNSHTSSQKGSLPAFSFSSNVTSSVPIEWHLTSTCQSKNREKLPAYLRLVLTLWYWNVNSLPLQIWLVPESDWGNNRHLHEVGGHETWPGHRGDFTWWAHYWSFHQRLYVLYTHQWVFMSYVPWYTYIYTCQ